MVQVGGAGWRDADWNLPPLAPPELAFLALREAQQAPWRPLETHTIQQAGV